MDLEDAQQHIRDLLEAGRRKELSAEGDLSPEMFRQLMEAHRANRGPR